MYEKVTQQENTHQQHLVLDLLKYRTTSTKGHKMWNKKSNYCKMKKSYCVIKFTNKQLDNININKILFENKNNFPIKNIKTICAYKYNMPIGRKIFNYNTIAMNFKGTSKEIENATCLCNKTEYQKFLNKDTGHIITGDMNIIQNNDLRTIMNMGTKYRMDNVFNKKYIINGIFTDINQYIEKTSLKYNTPKEFFLEWKNKVFKKIKNKIQKNYKKTGKKKYNKKDFEENIGKTKENFVITYVDKMQGNFAIICKKFYLQNLLLSFTKSEMYQKENTTKLITGKRIIAMYKRLKTKHESLKIPYLVLIPKLHKNPFKFRSITMAFNTYNQKASKILLKELSIIEKYIKTNKEHIFIKNSYELIEKIDKNINYNNILAMDFKELFDHICQKTLEKILIEMYEEYSQNVKFNIKIEEYKYLIKQVIYNNYITFGGEIYKQIKGIPQGLPSSNIESSLMLFSYEHKNKEKIKNKIIFRYIDDVIAFNIDEKTFSTFIQTS